MPAPPTLHGKGVHLVQAPMMGQLLTIVALLAALFVIGLIAIGQWGM